MLSENNISSLESLVKSSLHCHCHDL